MQKDFESWLSVMIRQQGAAHQSAAVMNTSQTSSRQQQPSMQAAGASFNASATDAKVNENLQAFYKARDAIYKDIK